MSFLRRLFGRGRDEPDDSPRGEAGGADEEPDDPGGTMARVDDAELEEDERWLDLELARAEQARLDELQQRQLRYAEHVWTPPPQGGERRADDEDRAGG